MLRQIRSLKGTTIQALDGQIGSVAEVYFDALLWKVRYLVAEAGSWLPGKRLLIARRFLGKPQGGDPVFPVLLNKQSIEKSATPTSIAGASTTQLRSTDDMLGFQIRAGEGSQIGVIDDFIADDRTWNIRYFVVNATAFDPARCVLLAPDWSRTVNWAEERIRMGVSCDAIQKSPVYDPRGTVNREYEARLYEHYGRRKYWMFRQSS